MPDTVLDHLSLALDLVVMERLTGGVFMRIGDQPPPSWFVHTFRAAGHGQPVTLSQAFPVLDTFLSEAEEFWERSADSRLESEALIVNDASGEQLPLSATAVAVKGRHFLLMQRLTRFADRQQILQRAREQALAHEDVIKRIQSMHRPVATLARLTDELARMELTGQQREQMVSITTQVETLRRLLDELPQMPRGSSARPR